MRYHKSIAHVWKRIFKIVCAKSLRFPSDMPPYTYLPNPSRAQPQVGFFFLTCAWEFGWILKIHFYESSRRTVIHTLHLCMSAGPGTLAPGSRDPGPESPGPRGPGPGPGIGCRGPARDGLGPRARRRAGRWGREARGPGPDAGGPGTEAEPFPPEPVWAASLSVLISRAWFPGLPRRTAIPGPRRDIPDRFRFFPAGIHLFARPARVTALAPHK